MYFQVGMASTCLTSDLVFLQHSFHRVSLLVQKFSLVFICFIECNSNVPCVILQPVNKTVRLLAFVFFFMMAWRGNGDTFVLVFALV